ncbi:hypothetical protein Pelo_9214 [Pelomyxa schiedti]|nr:hypothetical protein Pelo_9214 [Pelomyxa schiedti]
MFTSPWKKGLAVAAAAVAATATVALAATKLYEVSVGAGGVRVPDDAVVMTREQREDELGRIRAQAEDLDALRSKVGELERLRALVQEIDGLRAQVLDTDRLRARVAELEAEGRRAEEDAQAAETEMGDLKGKMDDMAKQNDELKKKGEAAETAQLEQTQLVAKLQAENTALHNEISAFPHQLTDCIWKHPILWSLTFGDTLKKMALPLECTNVVSNNSWTVEMKVKINAFDERQDTCLLASQVAAPERNGFLHLVLRTKKPYLGFWDNDTWAKDRPLNVGHWYHLVFAYDKVKQGQYIYVNGSASSTTGVIFSTGQGQCVPSTVHPPLVIQQQQLQPLVVGSCDVPITEAVHYTPQLNGEIEYLCIYPYVVPSAIIKAHAQASIPTLAAAKTAKS